MNLQINKQFRLSLSWASTTLRPTCAALDPWRNHNGRDPNAEAVEPEVVWLGTNKPIGAWDPGDRSGHMVVEATMLIVGDYEEHLVPLRASSQRLVDLLYEFLAFGHIVRWVVVVAGQELCVEISLFDHHVVWELTLLAVPLEMQIELMEFPYVL